MRTVTLKRRDLLGLLLLPAALAACGVKGRIQEPEGQENVYVYPRTYPDPKTVVPNNTATTTTGATGTAQPAPPPSAPTETFGSERTSTTVIKSQ